MACEESNGKCFTFLWKLENITCCLQKEGERIKSPPFVVDGTCDEAIWTLELYPRGNCSDYMSVYLCREDDCSDYSVEVQFELAFIGKDGSVLVSIKLEHNFVSNEGFGKILFVKREKVFDTKRSLFLPQDTLTVRCKMWNTDEPMSLDIRIFARTRIGVEKRSFLWNLEKLSFPEPEHECKYLIKSCRDAKALMMINFTLTGSDETVCSISLHDQTIKYSTLRLSLRNASGKRVKCSKEEFWFDDNSDNKEFTFFLTSEELFADKSLLLPNDVLPLHWEWTFTRGIISEEIEEVHTGSEVNVSDTHTVDNNERSFSNDLIDNFKSFYDDLFLSDVQLKTNTREFPAHKFILSASSSVFKAMFSRDMKENNSNCVRIEDLSDDTVSRMLLYMYTARVEDLTIENASHLYEAADKYAILSLKNICSSYMESNLSTSNACEMLLLSDLHADDDLKSYIQDYILEHVEEIVNSNEWKLVMETNSKLAAETVCLLFQRNL